MKIKDQHINIILIFGFFLIVGYLTFNLRETFSKKSNEPHTSANLQADTYIPKGFVLVPIELLNHDAVAALIASYGIVDLYYWQKNLSSYRLLLSGARILRAPLNPNQFAILISEKISTDFLQHGNSFWAAVQNSQTQINTSFFPQNLDDNDTKQATTANNPSMSNRSHLPKIEVQYYEEEK